MASHPVLEMGRSQNAVPEPTSFDVKPTYLGGRLIMDDHIRLLIIQPGKREEPIQAKMLVAQLSKSPGYEALSYTWGSMAQQQRIEITDKSPTGDTVLSISVTANCFAALRRLRYGITNPRTVWVDYICINQEDINERNHQMSLMRQIYKGAACVVVHIGESADRSDEAMDWIQEIDTPSGDNANSFSKVSRLTTRSDANEFGQDNNTGEPKNETRLAQPDKTIMQAFFGRPWFTRVWVLQEVHMGSKAIVYCGDRAVNWESFISFKHWNVSMLLVEELPFVITAKLSMFAYHTPARALLTVLRSSRHCNATDPRDKLYAILPLVQQMSGKLDSENFAKAYEMIKVDYHLTATQVFVNLGTYLLKTFGLDILKEVAGPSTLPGLPSWVPDWSLKFYSRRTEDLWFLGYSETGKNKSTVSEAQNANGELLHQLHVEGHYIGTITRVGGECNLPNDVFPLAEWYALMPDLMVLDENYHSFKTKRDAFCAVVGQRTNFLKVLDMMEERIQAYHEGSHARSKIMGEVAVSRLRRRLPPLTDNATTLVDFIESGLVGTSLYFVRDVFSTCEGRRFFVTDTGFLGVGLAHCKVGDCAYKILGASGGYIFRDRTECLECLECVAGHDQPEPASKMFTVMRLVGSCSFGHNWSEKYDTSAKELIIW